MLWRATSSPAQTESKQLQVIRGKSACQMHRRFPLTWADETYPWRAVGGQIRASSDHRPDSDLKGILAGATFAISCLHSFTSQLALSRTLHWHCIHI